MKTFRKATQCASRSRTQLTGEAKTRCRCEVMLFWSKYYYFASFYKQMKRHNKDRTFEGINILSLIHYWVTTHTSCKVLSIWRNRSPFYATATECVLVSFMWENGHAPAFRLSTRLASSTDTVFSSVFVEYMWVFRTFIFELYAVCTSYKLTFRKEASCVLIFPK